MGRPETPAGGPHRIEGPAQPLPPGLWDSHHRESRGRLPGPLPGCLGRGPALPQSRLFFRPPCLALPLICGGQAHPLHRGQWAGPRPREGGEPPREGLSKPRVEPWDRPQQGPPTFLPSPAFSSDFSGLPRRGVGAATSPSSRYTGTRSARLIAFTSIMIQQWAGLRCRYSLCPRLGAGHQRDSPRVLVEGTSGWVGRYPETSCSLPGSRAERKDESRLL